MTNAEARFNKSLRPRKPEGSLARTAQDVHLDSHAAPELRRRPYCNTIKQRIKNEIQWYNAELLTEFPHYKYTMLI